MTDENLQNLPKIKKMARSCDALVKWKTETTTNFLNEDIRSGSQTVAIELTTGSKNLFDVRLPKDCTFVVGNERFGISPELLQKCSYAVQIPMYGVNGSMNVSHALGIVLFEWRRQHSFPNSFPNSFRSNEPSSHSEENTSPDAKQQSGVLNQGVRLHSMSSQEEVTLPRLPDDVETELAAMSSLLDETLWILARSTISIRNQEQLIIFGQESKLRSLSRHEQREYDRILGLCDRTMIRRATAASLLSKRGYDMSDPTVLLNEQLENKALS